MANRLASEEGKAAKSDNGKAVPLPKRSKAASGPKRRKRSKSALVLGGGGFTGVVYEVGALRALNLLAVDWSVNDFDIYIGTSAGAVVGSLAANNISPEEMMRAINSKHASAIFPELSADTLMRPNYSEFFKRSVRLPLNLFSFARAASRSVKSLTAVDLLTHFADVLPSGFYTGNGVERYLSEVFSQPGHSNDFRELEKTLLLCAADLDTCERIVIGGEGWDDVPISEGVQASTAIPMFYKPCHLKGRTVVDGGIVSTTNIDLAVEAGAELIVLINPIVPFVNDRANPLTTSDGVKARSISEMGFPKIAYQTFKLLAYQRLHELVLDWDQRYPDIDLILIEPSPNDELMFETNILDYASRIQVARHGFESVTKRLENSYGPLEEMLGHHGIDISQDCLHAVTEHFDADNASPQGWRQIFEQTTANLLSQAFRR